MSAVSSFDRQADLAGPIVPGAVSAGPGASGRLLGIDLARAVALLGMMATHTMDLVDAAGDPQPVGLIAGKAAALFAVLAGFSVELSTRRYGRWRDAAASLAVRGLLISILGLVLGSLSSSIAVVLVNYGVLFLLAPLVLRLPARWLAATTVLWLVASPVASHLIRDGLGLQRAVEAPELSHLAQPGELALGVLLTGYYPVLQWMSYILLGMAVAKLDIGRHLLGLFACGLSLFIAGRGVSWLMLNVFGGDAALVEVSQMWGTDLTAALFTGSYGVTPATSWWWLAIAGPHSGTPFDLLSTGGTAVMTIVACQAAAELLGRRSWVLAPLSAPGSMPLSVYSAHVVLLEITRLALVAEPWNGPGTVAEQTTEFAVHALTFIAIPLLWKMFVNPRGPFEGGIEAIIRAASPGSRRPASPLHGRG